MNRHPVSSRGGETHFLIVFHAIIRQISNYCFCAISSCELSVCAIFYAFSSYDMTVESNELIEMGWHQKMRKRREQLPFCPI